jgi:hypothetical protein
MILFPQIRRTFNEKKKRYPLRKERIHIAFSNTLNTGLESVSYFVHGGTSKMRLFCDAKDVNH